MTGTTLVNVPFHMGMEDVAVGHGPTVLLAAGADRVVGTTLVHHIRKRERECTGLDAVVDVNRQVRYAVREAREQDLLAIVLAGNCNSCLGSVAGLEGETVGVLWFDAHGDYNTPETSVSGMLDGMALAALVGDCHQALRERIGLHDTVRQENVLLVGSRDLDEMERVRLEESHVLMLPGAEGVEHAMQELASRVSTVYVHLDIDVLDPVESPGVNYRGPGGMRVADVERLLEEAADILPLGAVALANYNPSMDTGSVTAQIALRLLRAVSRG